MLTLDSGDPRQYYRVMDALIRRARNTAIVRELRQRNDRIAARLGLTAEELRSVRERLEGWHVRDGDAGEFRAASR